MNIHFAGTFWFPSFLCCDCPSSLLFTVELVCFIVSFYCNVFQMGRHKWLLILSYLRLQNSLEAKAAKIKRFLPLLCNAKGEQKKQGKRHSGWKTSLDFSFLLAGQEGERGRESITKDSGRKLSQHHSTAWAGEGGVNCDSAERDLLHQERDSMLGITGEWHSLTPLFASHISVVWSWNHNEAPADTWHPMIICRMIETFNALPPCEVCQDPANSP